MTAEIPTVVSSIGARRELPLVVASRWLRAEESPRLRLTKLLVSDGDDMRRALTRHGALLLRGTGVSEPEDFQWFVEELAGAQALNYEAGVSPRRRVAGNVYTATELPAHIPLGLHNELAYTSRYPRVIAFLCRSQARTGGESLLADGRAVLAHLDRDIVAEFEKRGVRYTFRYPGPNATLDRINRLSGGLIGKTWMDVFETADRQLAETRCREAGLELIPADRDEILAISDRPAIVTHPRTGERAWFNHAHLFEPNPAASGWLAFAETKVAYIWPLLHMHAASYGDGAPIPTRTLDRISRTIAGETVRVALAPTDLLVLDNLLCMHGRARFRGPRKLLVAMA